MFKNIQNFIDVPYGVLIYELCTCTILEKGMMSILPTSVKKKIK